MTIGSWSGFYTPYDEQQIREAVPLAAGVYVLWVRGQGGGWNQFYVAKAENLESNLLGHLSDNEPNPCIKRNAKNECGFSWIEITMEPERAGVEKYLYDLMKPECNVTDPGGKPLKIEAPPEVRG